MRTAYAFILGTIAGAIVVGFWGMLSTIVVVLLVLWALGLVTSYTAGGLVHALLVIAVIVIVLQFVTGRRSV